MELSIVDFNLPGAQIKQIQDAVDLAQYRSASNTLWICVSGFGGSETIRQIGELFEIHPLTMEDILHTDLQSKIETFENYRFLSIKTIRREKHFHHFHSKNKKEAEDEPDEFQIGQISIIIMKNILITFQETPGDYLEGIRKKITDGAQTIRKAGTDYLAYMIIDAIVDEYFLALNHLEDDIENFEDRATKTSDYTFIEEIQDTKKYLLRMKRAIYPASENIALITRRGDFFTTGELTPFLHDLSDHLNHAIITVENYREWLSNIMDVNLSVLSYQTNKVMKVLAIISTIFIPLTFIAGVYGMNFEFMPELGLKFGYPVILGGMAFIALLMIIYFKIRRWF